MMSQENIKKVYRIDYANHKVKLQELADTLEILKSPWFSELFGADLAR